MKTIFLILLLAVICCSQESQTYLIYKDKLPVSLSVVKAKGVKIIADAGGQPFRITSWTQPSNTSYFIVNIVPQNSTEIDFLANWEQQEIIKLIKIFDVVTLYDSRIGGYRRKGVTTKINDLPSDFYIEISTP